MLTANVFRSVEAPVKLIDDDLDYWAKVYVQLDLLKRGYTFEDFLRATPQVREDAAREAAGHARQRSEHPAVIARAPIEGPHGEPFALTSKDMQVFRKAKLRSVQVVGNGRMIEKLRHHRHPRSSGIRDFIPLKKV